MGRGRAGSRTERIVHLLLLIYISTQRREEGLENSNLDGLCTSTHRGAPVQEFVLNFSRDHLGTWSGLVGSLNNIVRETDGGVMR